VLSVGTKLMTLNHDLERRWLLCVSMLNAFDFKANYVKLAEGRPIVSAMKM